MAGDDVLWKQLAQRQSPPQSDAARDAEAGPADADAEKIAGPLARYDDRVIETVRKTVKTVGQEAAFLRVTHEEKQRLADVAYSFKRKGIRTSENELVRIGLNFLLLDHRDSGKESVLERVLAALNA